MYQLPKVFVRDLAPGVRSIFTRFIAATKAAVDARAELKYSDDSYHSRADVEYLEDGAERHKQAMMRAIIRLQNKSPEDVEGIKRDLRKMMTVIEAIYQAPDQASTIIKSTKAMEDIARIKGNRAAHPYHAGVKAFEKQLADERERGRQQGLKEAKRA